MYNLVRLAMGEAARRERVAVDRISFIDAMRWLVVNPSRPGLFEPRVRKRRPKEFPVMKRPRWEPRKDLVEKDIAA